MKKKTPACGEKLRSSRGETLVEVLVSVVIVVLSAGALAALTGTATRINTQAAANTDALFQQLSTVEAGAPVAEEGSEAAVLVTISDPDPWSSEQQTIPVDVVYSGGQGQLTAYRGGAGQ